MAEMYAIKKDDLTDIADAIRIKRGIADMIPVGDMAMQIGLISGGKVIASGSFIHPNQTTNFTIDTGCPNAKTIVFCMKDVNEENLLPIRSLLCNIFSIEYGVKFWVARSTTEGSPKNMNVGNVDFNNATSPTTFDNGVLDVKATHTNGGRIYPNVEYIWAVLS